jgi:Fe-S oxidoreductase
MPDTPFFEVNEAIRGLGGEDLNLCMQCGTCSAVCPWRNVETEFFIRRLIRFGQLGVEGSESEEVLFGCTTCGRCVDNCPRGVAIIDVVKGMRAMGAEVGAMPATLKAAAGSLESHGNPWGEPRAKRFDWAKDLDLPAFGPDTEYLLSVCCTSCYDARSRKIARALVEVLRAAGVSFGVIGTDESCCGEAIRKTGNEEAFSRLAEANVNLFNGRGVRKIIVTSPHCFHTYTKEYPALGGEWEVIHHSQLLAKLVADGRLKLDGKVAAKVAYHDPCYLGRHSRIFDEPRAVLEAAGATAAPMMRERDFSLCCGGGGGRVWMETAHDQRFSVLRVREAAEAGAEVLATACPYCLTLLEDSRKTEGFEQSLEVLDVAEVLARALK